MGNSCAVHGYAVNDPTEVCDGILPLPGCLSNYSQLKCAAARGEKKIKICSGSEILFPGEFGFDSYGSTLILKDETKIECDNGCDCRIIRYGTWVDPPCSFFELFTTDSASKFSLKGIELLEYYYFGSQPEDEPVDPTLIFPAGRSLIAYTALVDASFNIVEGPVDINMKDEIKSSGKCTKKSKKRDLAEEVDGHDPKRHHGTSRVRGGGPQERKGLAEMEENKLDRFLLDKGVASPTSQNEPEESFCGGDDFFQDGNSEEGNFTSEVIYDSGSTGLVEPLADFIEIARAMDTDGNGLVNCEEYLLASQLSIPQEQACTVFKHYLGAMEAPIDEVANAMRGLSFLTGHPRPY